MAKLPIEGSTYFPRAGDDLRSFRRTARRMIRELGIDNDALPDLLAAYNLKRQRDDFDLATKNWLAEQDKFLDPERDEGPIPGIWEFGRIAQKLNETHALSIRCDRKLVRNLISHLNVVRGSYNAQRHAPDVDETAQYLLDLSDAAKQIGGLTTLSRSGLKETKAFGCFDKVIDAMVDSNRSRDSHHAWLQLRACDDLINSIGTACKAAADKLGGLERKRGRSVLSAYDDFLLLMARVAKRFGIRATTQTNRKTDKPGGPFFDLVREFEVFLPNNMRAASDAACAARIKACRKRHEETWKEFL